MSNISIESAVSVAQNISGAMPDSRIVAAHRALDDKIDEANAGAQGFTSETLREWKAHRLVLKLEMQRRGLTSSERPARALSFQQQGVQA